MKSTESIKINSLRELQLQMPRIVQAVNANPRLALAAATNPLLAIEQLGYKLSPEAQKEVEQYARFGPDNLKRLAEIETEFGKLLATKTVPVNLPEARALFEKSGYAQPDKPVADKKTTLKPTKNQGLEASLENIFASRVRPVDEEKNSSPNSPPNTLACRCCSNIEKSIGNGNLLPLGRHLKQFFLEKKTPSLTKLNSN